MPTQRLGPRQEEFLAALESGEWPKVTERRCRMSKDGKWVTGFCAMGVATHLFDPRPWADKPYSLPWDKDVSPYGAATPEVVKALQLHDEKGTPEGNPKLYSVIRMNDLLGYSFARIARVVRENAGNYFKKPA